jgi:cell division septation protein DedD
LPSETVSSKVTDTRSGNFWETPPREPVFVMDAGAATQHRGAWVVAGSACLAVTIGLTGYWYSKPPSQRQTAIVQPAESRRLIPPPPAAALTAIAAPDTVQGIVQHETQAVPVPTPTSSEGPRFAIRMATFQSRGRTEQALQELRGAGFTAYSVESLLANGTRAFAVFLGPYTVRSEVDRDRDRAQQIQGYGSGFIVQIE